MEQWKTFWLLAILIVVAGCVTPGPQTPTPTITPIPTLSPTPIVGLEVLFSALAADKDFPYGYKAYYPPYPSPAMGDLIAQGPGALPDLQTELAASQNPQYRKVLLFVVTHIDDPRSEEALVKALGDDDLKDLSAYLLGNYRYRPSTGDYNQPGRFIRDCGKVLDALFPLFLDSREYPVTADRFVVKPQVGDLALGAFIRIGGPMNFDIDVNKYRMIGWEIPEFTVAERGELLRRIEKYRV